MIDTSFYVCNGDFTIEYVIDYIKCRSVYNASGIRVSGVNTPELAYGNQMCFLFNDKALLNFNNLNAKIIVIADYCYKTKNYLNTEAILVSDNIDYSYSKALELFYRPKYLSSSLGREEQYQKVKNNSLIDKSASIGNNTKIGANVVIGGGVRIGKNCVIQDNTIISYSIIGDNVHIGPSCIIGQEGFGYAMYNGRHYSVFHIGRVIIEDEVIILANSVIDRGLDGDTTIGSGTLIDSLVKIAHNVTIGKNCLLMGQVGVAGWVDVGNDCILYGQVGVVDHVKIGNGVYVTAKSMVTKNVPDNCVISGYPAIIHSDWNKQTAYYRYKFKQARQK